MPVDLDFADHHRGKRLMGLVALQRFTGHGITADYLARIEAADIGFRIVHDLPTLYPHRRCPLRRRPARSEPGRRRPKQNHHTGAVIPARSLNVGSCR